MKNESRKASLEAVGISCAGPLVRSLAGMQGAEAKADLCRVEPNIPGSDSKVIQRAADACEPVSVSFSVKVELFYPPQCLFCVTTRGVGSVLIQKITQTVSRTQLK